MPDPELDPILIQVTVPLPVPMIFAALIDPEQLKGWLADTAQVAPRVGGEFRLTYSSDPPFESRGEVQKLTPDLDLGFTWTGPPEFASLMNGPPPKTHVYFRLQESPEGVDITMEHAGWVSGDAWEAARSWHFHFWDDRLQRLKDHLIKTAYG